MAKVARIGDVIRHGATITGSIIEGSTDTLTNGRGVARKGDHAICNVRGHGQPIIASGSVFTLTNGRETARVGDVLTCGAVIASGSEDRDVSDDFIPLEDYLLIDDSVVAPYSERDVGSQDDDPDSDDGYSVLTPDPQRQAQRDLIERRIEPRTVEQVDDTPAPPVVLVPTSCNFDPLETFQPSMQLSGSFDLGSVTINTAISRKAVVPQHNLSTPEIVCNLKALCQNILEPLAAKYGRNNLIITSGFRTGASSSQHERGMAVDVQFKDQWSGSLNGDEYWERVQWTKANLPYDQFILEYLGNKPWFHLSFNSTGDQRRQLLTAVKNGSYAAGLQRLA